MWPRTDPMHAHYSAQSLPPSAASYETLFKLSGSSCGLISSLKLFPVSFGPKHFHLPLVSKHPYPSLTMGLLSCLGLVLAPPQLPRPPGTLVMISPWTLSYSDPRGLLYTTGAQQRTQPRFKSGLHSRWLHVWSRTLLLWAPALITQYNSFWSHDYSPPGSSVHGILQAKILECVAMPPSHGLSQLRNRTCISGISYTVGRFLTHWATWEAPGKSKGFLNCRTGVNKLQFTDHSQSTDCSWSKG